MKFEYRCYHFNTSLYKFYEDGRVEYFGTKNGVKCWLDGSDFKIDKNKYRITTFDEYYNNTKDIKFKEHFKKELFYRDVLNDELSTTDNN